MNQSHYDTIIIGAGPGGLSTAFDLSKKQSVLIIENDLWGGTCPNRGCDPKKMLYSAVETKQRQEAMQGFGLTGSSIIDWPKLMAFKSAYTDKVPANTLAGLSAANIKTVHGSAKFISKSEINVNTETYTADNFVIAAGQSPVVPDIPGSHLLKTSTDFLSLEELPDKIAFIGAGYISIELANIAAIAGSEVHIIQHNSQILRGFPIEYTTRLIENLKTNGVHFHFDTNITEITEGPLGFQMLDDKGLSLTVDLAISAMGRQPNVNTLNLPIAGAESDSHGIIVDSHLKTKNDRIYAIGDIVSRKQPKLTPVSTFEGHYVADQLLKKSNSPITYPPIPMTVYASPQLSQVGITIEQAKNEPEHYDIRVQETTNWYSFNRIKESEASVTTIFDKSSNLLVGAVAYTTIAEELINYLTPLIANKTPKTDVTKLILAYPTPASDLAYYL
ncbi:dihydrolipoyl dehydrogenase family protein [Dellaglioa sp. P0083]|uniref:dihydrolipoyl dehydrogenase family protein n=1 Tax=Dellaglioa kimchii TaxID=3344667 RepID=UPI0038D38DD8